MVLENKKPKSVVIYYYWYWNVCTFLLYIDGLHQTEHNFHLQQSIELRRFIYLLYSCMKINSWLWLVMLLLYLYMVVRNLILKTCNHKNGFKNKNRTANTGSFRNVYVLHYTQIFSNFLTWQISNIFITNYNFVFYNTVNFIIQYR